MSPPLWPGPGVSLTNSTQRKWRGARFYTQTWRDWRILLTTCGNIYSWNPFATLSGSSKTHGEAMCRPQMSFQPKSVSAASPQSPASFGLPTEPLGDYSHMRALPTIKWPRWAQLTHRTEREIFKLLCQVPTGPCHLLKHWETFSYYFFLPLFGSMSASRVNQTWDLIDQFSKPLISFHILNLYLILYFSEFSVIFYSDLPAKLKGLQGQGLCFFYSALYLQHLAQCLAHQIQWFAD